jgi:hypothetical protein
MTKPSHGKLYQDSDGHWIFCRGKNIDLSTGIKLPDLVAIIINL